MVRAGALQRRLYRGGRPGRLTRVMNRWSAAVFGAGLLVPAHYVTLEVTGRRSGRTIRFPLVMTTYRGGRYLVAMLGERANWVANVRAAGGAAVLCHQGRDRVRLVELPAGERAPVLRCFLEDAPGARAHLPVSRGAPLPAFEAIAGAYPVFRVTPAQPGPAAGDGAPPASGGGPGEALR